MKKSIKLKELRKMNNLRDCRYCGLQNLLRYTEADYYYSNAYGWRFDVYCVNGLTIISGYDSIKQATELTAVEEYDKKAEEVLRSVRTYNEAKKQLDALLEEFCNINR